VIDDIDFYSKENDLVKAVTRTQGDSTLIEYYFDKSYLRYQVYFIYSVKSLEKGTLENRYYFNEDEIDNRMIRWLDEEKKEVDVESVEYYYKEQPLLFASEDLSTVWNNYRLNLLHPTYTQLIEQIDEKVERISEAELKVVTETEDVDKQLGEEGSYEEIVKSYNSVGELVISCSGAGADHGFEKSCRYYNKGELIMETTEEGYWYFIHIPYHEIGGNEDGASFQRTYYKNGESFRQVHNKSVQRHFFTDLPQINHEFTTVIDDFE